MPETRKEYDREFREGAVRIVEETGKPAHREYPAQKQRFSAFVQVLRSWLPVVGGRV